MSEWTAGHDPETIFCFLEEQKPQTLSWARPEFEFKMIFFRKAKLPYIEKFLFIC